MIGLVSVMKHFKKLYPIGSKEAKAGKTDDTIFKLYSRGLATSRDAYIYNFSHEACGKNACAMIDDYLGALQELSTGNQGSLKLNDIVKRHSSNVRWDLNLKNNLKRKKTVKYSSNHIWKNAVSTIRKAELLYRICTCQ